MQLRFPLLTWETTSCDSASVPPSVSPQRTRKCRTPRPAHDLLIVYGAQLERRVILADQAENTQFMLGLSRAPNVAVKDLENRPYVDVALFWQFSMWSDSWARTKEYDRIPIHAAEQHGRFYPRYGPELALFAFDSMSFQVAAHDRFRVVHSDAARIFAKRGIPVVMSLDRLPK